MAAFSGDGIADLGDDLIDVAWLHQIIKGTLLHTVNGGFNIRVTRNVALSDHAGTAEPNEFSPAELVGYVMT